MLSGIISRWCSPPEVIVAGEAKTSYYLHILCALAQRQDVVV